MSAQACQLSVQFDFVRGRWGLNYITIPLDNTQEYNVTEERGDFDEQKYWAPTSFG